MLGAVALPDIPTGRSLVVRSETLPAETGGTVSTMSPGQSAVTMFAEMLDSLKIIQQNTFQTVELLKTAVLGTPDQQRRESLERAETDEPPAALETGGEGRGGRLSGFFSKLNKLNPFSGESSALVKFIAAGLGLIGLNVFKDKLVPKLSALLEFFFGDGKEGSFSSIMDSILEKVKKIVEDLKERIEPIIEDLRLRFEVMKEKVETFLTKVNGIVTIVSDVIKKIEDYVDSFDVDGIEGLSEEERKELVADIEKKIKDGLYKLFGDLIGGAKGILGLLTVAGIMTRINKAAPVVRAGAPFAARYAAMGGLSVMGVAGLGLLAAAGIYTAYNKVFDSINDALDEETGKVDKSKALSNMMGGTLNKEGGIMNALDNSFKFGLMGATLGLFLGGPPGAVAGFAIGSALGGVLGLIGSDKIDKFLDKPLDAEISKAYKTVTQPKKEDTDPDILQSKIDTKLLEKAELIEKHGEHSGHVTRINREIKSLEKKLENVPSAKIHFEEVELFNLQTERDTFKNAIKSIDESFAHHKSVIAQGGEGTLDDFQMEEMKELRQFHVMDLRDIEQEIADKKRLLIELNPSSSITRMKSIPVGPTGKLVNIPVTEYTPGVTYLDGKKVDNSTTAVKTDQTFVNSDLSINVDKEVEALVGTK